MPSWMNYTSPDKIQHARGGESGPMGGAIDEHGASGATSQTHDTGQGGTPDWMNYTSPDNFNYSSYSDSI